jgi:hypothetical protein
MVQLIAMTDGAAEIIAVKVPGLPGPGIRQGHPVKVSGLVAQPWTMGDRSGVAFRAARIEPAVPRRRPRRADQRGGRAQESVREGTGAAANELPVPSTHQAGCANTRLLHQRWSPMMRPHRSPLTRVAIAGVAS